MPEHNLFSIINEAQFSGEKRQKHCTGNLALDAFEFGAADISHVALLYDHTENPPLATGKRKSGKDINTTLWEHTEIQN